MGRVALVALPARSQCPRLGDRLSDVRARDPRAREPARDRGCRRADAGLRTRARPTYAPVNWLCPTARIAVVGTTPSANTMPIAYQTAARRLAAGGGARAALQAVKRTAAFSGFRFRLIKRIDALGVASYLGTASSAAQFELPHARLLHATSVRRALSDLQGRAELQRPVSAASLGPPELAPLRLRHLGARTGSDSRSPHSSAGRPSRRGTRRSRDRRAARSSALSRRISTSVGPRRPHRTCCITPRRWTSCTRASTPASSRCGSATSPPKPRRSSCTPTW